MVVLAVLLLTGLLLAALGTEAPRLDAWRDAPPGEGEVDLTATPAGRDAAREGAGAGPREPGSTGLSLTDPPADAPWLTEDGEPWQGDLTLDPDRPAEDPSGTTAPAPMALDGTGWRIALSSDIVAATGDDDVVVAGTRDGIVHALDARTGAPRWVSELGTASSQLLLHDEVVVVRHAGGQASVLDRDDGTRLWRRAPGLEEDRVLAVGTNEDVVLLVLGLPDRPRLLAAEVHDGSRRWEQLLADGWVADRDGAVTAIGAVDDELTGFDPASGAPRWVLALGPDEQAVELVGEVVLVRGSNGFRWVDATSGEVRFLSNRLLGTWLAHPSDGLVLASAGGTSLLLSTTASGDERWRTSLPRPGGRRSCCIGLAPTTTGEVLVTDRRGPEPIVRVLEQHGGEVVAELSALEAIADRRVLTVTSSSAVVVGPAGTLGIDRDDRTPRWRVPERTRLLSSDPVLLATERGGDGLGRTPTASLLAPP